MFQQILKGIQRSWIILLVLMLGTLSLYTNHPIYGAPAATPTPDVQTVPKPELIATPTNTPFPTPTANGSDSPNAGGGAVATRQPGDDNNDDNTDDNNNNDDNTDDSDNNSDNNSGGNTNNNNTGNTGNNGSPSNTDNTTGSTQPDSARLTGIVTVVTLNLRKGPSTSEHIVDTLFMNDVVEVLGRDSSGRWWYVCCGARAQQSGWVSTQFITPDFLGTQANTLLPVMGGAAAQAAAPVQPATTSAAGKPAEAPRLLLEMRPLPAFAWQGQTMELHFVVHNKSDQVIANIELQDDLPAELAFVKAVVGSQGIASAAETQEPGPLFTITWPEIGPNTQVTATVTIQIATATNGAMIDNLAVVKSAAGNEALGGMTIAMPPTALPRFSAIR